MLDKNFLYNSDLIIYGAGNSFNVFDAFVISKIHKESTPHIVAHVDKRFSSSRRNSNEKPPEWLLSSEVICSFNLVPIIICIGDQKIRDSIKSMLVAAGYNFVYSMFDFWDFHAGYDSRCFSDIVSDFKSLDPHFTESKIKMLSDDHSRELFTQFISTFSFPRQPYLTRSSPEDEQFEPALGFFDFNSQTQVQILQTGAHRGEFYDAYVKKFPLSTGDVYLLEPDKTSFSSFHFLENLTRDSALRASCFNFGVSERNEEVLFSGKGVASRMETDELVKSTDFVKLVRVDDFFATTKFSHMIIDVEGHERSFILGAERAISSSAPNICISVYHYPKDIFEIMSLINDIRQGYSFYLRNYSGFNTDTLLYAISR